MAPRPSVRSVSSRSRLRSFDSLATVSNMTNTNSSEPMWTFQTRDAVDESGLHKGYATDARGLRLRLESGYGWVNKNDGQGWRQLEVAIKQAESEEHAAQIVSGYNLAPGLKRSAARR